MSVCILTFCSLIRDRNESPTHHPRFPRACVDLSPSSNAYVCDASWQSRHRQQEDTFSQINAETMKFSIASILAASSLATSSAFVVQTPNSRLSTAVGASRSAQKIATRTKWLEGRGITDDAVEEGSSGAGLMTNSDGLEYVKLVHPESGASAEVYLYGGVVTSYKDADGTDFIAVRPDAKMDGSKPISGGLSHCWPQVSQMCFQQHHHW